MWKNCREDPNVLGFSLYKDFCLIHTIMFYFIFITFSISTHRRLESSILLDKYKYIIGWPLCHNRSANAMDIGLILIYHRFPICNYYIKASTIIARFYSRLLKSEELSLF